MTALGDLYATGVGVPQDMKEAAKWYQAAASGTGQGAVSP
jgi:TPR repeat protein